MTRGRAGARAALLGLAVVGLDQLTKAIARGAVERGGEDPILPGVKLVNSRNSGIAFGALEDGGVLVGVLVAVALAALAFFFWRFGREPLAWLACGLLFGGALGNVVDRVVEGAVTDFVKLPAWPAFNLADVAITFGVLVLLLVLEREGKGEPDGAAGRA
jgi:signal peptidase II